eukprot:5574645-Lingulodinium_polyedra.AAC.1
MEDHQSKALRKDVSLFGGHYGDYVATELAARAGKHTSGYKVVCNAVCKHIYRKFRARLKHCGADVDSLDQRFARAESIGDIFEAVLACVLFARQSRPVWCLQELCVYEQA